MNETAGRWFRSPFTLPNGKPSFSEVWASSLEEAQAIADVRGFGPAKPYAGPKLHEFRPSKIAVVNGFSDPSVLHSLAYIGFLAARSGVVTALELTEDGSAFHELAHALTGPNMKGGKQAEIALEAMRILERKTPGVPPSHVEMRMRCMLRDGPAMERSNHESGNDRHCDVLQARDRASGQSSAGDP